MGPSIFRKWYTWWLSQSSPGGCWILVSSHVPWPGISWESRTVCRVQPYIWLENLVQPAGGYLNDIISPTFNQTSTLSCYLIFHVPQETIFEAINILHIGHYFVFATGRVLTAHLGCGQTQVLPAAQQCICCWQRILRWALQKLAAQYWWRTNLAQAQASTPVIWWGGSLVFLCLQWVQTRCAVKEGS